MTKLVTGIEAIQSGKEFRFVYKEYGNPVSYGEWINRTNSLGNLSAEDFVSQSWEIKQEPREFWVEINGMKPTYVSNTKPEEFVGEIIKVREVLDDE